VTKPTRAKLTADDYVKGILAQDVSILSRAITLVESKNIHHQNLAKDVLKNIMDATGNAKRIGISGTPGVGKSTFIESFGMRLIEKGLKVAVLAIDPTSYKTGGSILGDKTRMGNLSTAKNAFVRPSPSGKTLGGVASKTRESMLLCEAAGFDVIIIETVGVGQSEVAVSKIVDFFLLLMQPGSGDDLQGIKRGILELADLVAVNKADGDQLAIAKIALREFQVAMHILRHDESWHPEVLTCSGLKGIGLDAIWENIEKYYKVMREDDSLDKKRSNQISEWMWELLTDKLENAIKNNPKLDRLMKDKRQAIINNNDSLLEAVDEIYNSIIHIEK